MLSIELTTTLAVLRSEHAAAVARLKDIDSRIAAVIEEPMKTLTESGDVDGLQELVNQLPRFVYVATYNAIQETPNGGER